MDNIPRKGYKLDFEKETVFVPGFGEIPWVQIINAYSSVKSAYGMMSSENHPWHKEKKPVPKEFIEAYNEVKAGRMTTTNAIKSLGIGRTTWYRYKDKYEAELGK